MNETSVHHYFVDEAGCLTLFNRRGRTIVGEEGVSHTFMLGVARLPDPDNVGRRLTALREELLADPYFRGVPSMQPEAGRTARLFHAKDDPAEVRREVFRLLPSFQPKVVVFMRRKRELARQARQRLMQTGQRFSANEVYDDLVKRAFRDLLHKADECRIVFARRGKSERTEALRDAIERARSNFVKKWGDRPSRPIVIESRHPSDVPGLQVIDYYLWAIQRLFERGEGRFFELLRSNYRLIADLDDKRRKPYGEYYTDHNPLDVQKIKPVAG